MAESVGEKTVQSYSWLSLRKDRENTEVEMRRTKNSVKAHNQKSQDQKFCENTQVKSARPGVPLVKVSWSAQAGAATLHGKKSTGQAFLCLEHSPNK